MKVTLIAAVAKNGVIGADGEMPWHYPEDLRQFKERTLGHPVIMGRVTFEAITARLDSPLPGRTNIVLTRNPEGVDAAVGEGGPPVYLATTVEDALEHARQADPNEVFVAGGASVYEQFLPVADRLLITEIHEPHEGDTRFPEWNEAEWTERDRDEREDLSFVTYDRREDTI